MKLVKLVLASASPRRRELLEQIDLPFTTFPSTLEEPPFQGDDPIRYALDLAQHKATEVAGRFPRSMIIGADTIVVVDDQVLGKPETRADALNMLTSLSNKSHKVITAYSLQLQELRILENHHVTTRVHFRKLLKSEIMHYIESGAPFDKAGGYGIQDYSGIFVDSIEGCFYNVVGLPISDLHARLMLLLQQYDLALEPSPVTNN